MARLDGSGSRSGEATGRSYHPQDGHNHAAVTYIYILHLSTYVFYRTRFYHRFAAVPQLWDQYCKYYNKYSDGKLRKVPL